MLFVGFSCKFLRFCLEYSSLVKCSELMTRKVQSYGSRANEAESVCLQCSVQNLFVEPDFFYPNWEKTRPFLHFKTASFHFDGFSYRQNRAKFCYSNQIYKCLFLWLKTTYVCVYCYFSIFGLFSLFYFMYKNHYIL